ncbi:beta-propeller domain-containing protein [Peribacillus alkalitolerans]|uniref:beta-propeller domain-containing protein n=1 Tax=Peribacillus alkalitolerans TaxID=1550385 RepID=UPI0013CFDD5D|nr:beta-propeller domain-containing protein [Peribacillus alkalitolerans]
MKKVMYGIFLLFIIGGIGITYFSTEPKVLATWNGTEEQIVLPNGVLKVPFTQEISSHSVNPKNFYVEDEEGNKLDVFLSLSDDGETVSVSPPKGGYDGKKITLYIKKGIKTEMGRSISKGHSFSFSVKEELPVIGNETRLKKYFTAILEDQKKSEGFFSDAAKQEKSSSSEDSVGDKGYSETNVQVQGIDEGDHVKTNGTNIFQIVESYIRIIKAVPANSMKQESLITYDYTFHPEQLYVHNNKLVVIGQSYREEVMNREGSSEKKMIHPMRGIQTTKVFVYDISNPAKPTEIRVLETEGNFNSSRKKDGKLYVITQYMPDLWLMREDDGLELRPMIFDSKMDTELHPVSYRSIKYMPNSKEASYSNITTLDLDETNKKSLVSTFLGSGSDVYMSDDHLFFAVRNYSNQQNKRAEIGWFYSPDTTIYKFSIKGMKVTFQASAEIEGNVLNQFSMDEHKGYFRVATTEGNTWDEKSPSTNHLFILDENLHQVGNLKDLARGEKIYSARFMGDRVYIVTFKEVDPLFVIDTSNPKQPKILGELKIPGFSNYLHPYDEHYLIGFGHDTKILADKNNNVQGQPRIVTNGVKISLFDVSDFSNPKEKFSQVIGDQGSYSPLNYDHKALLWNKNKNMFAFPVSVYRDVKGTEFEQKFEFQGGYVYSVDPTNGFLLKNKITHQKGTPFYEDWEDVIDRFVYIGDTLYSISPYTITAHDFTTSQRLGTLEIK